MNRNQRRAEKKLGRPPTQVATKNPTPAVTRPAVTRDAPSAVQKLFADAFQHHQAGRLGEAALLYQQVLAADSRHADSLHLLGLLASQLGRHDSAIEMVRNAIAINAKSALYHSTLGNTLKELGRLEEAVAAYRSALGLEPDYLEVHNNLGLALQDQGRLDEAVACYRKALGCKPDYLNALYNLGNALLRQGRLDEAVACYRKFLGLKPDFPEVHNNLGAALKSQGRVEEAVASYLTAIGLRPDFPEAHSNLGAALKEQGRLDEAVACYSRALGLKPDLLEAHNNLGNARLDQGRLDEAVACFHMALGLRPDYPEAHNNLGNALKEQGRLDEAVASYSRAIGFKQDYPEAHSNLGTVLQDQGRLDEAVACHRHALGLKPDYPDAHSNLLWDMNYMPHISLAEAREEACRFGRMVAARSAAPFSAWACAAAPARLRVGFVSGDLLGHPVGYFLEGLLNEIDPGRVELLAYPTHNKGDNLTLRLRRRFDAWTPLTGLDDEAAARQIHADGVHVLVDLSGHTANNRLPLFVRRPAPVQASWLGYFATTGVTEIDYLLADPHVAPPEEEHHFTEKIWRLPESYLCFTPPDVELEVAPLPALPSGPVTFGCFNNLTKMNDAVVGLWARVLRAVPDSRLFLKAKQLDDRSVSETTRQRFAAHGIDTGRLILEGRSPRLELLRAYDRVDIALDPFPYPGGTTSVEGLWMGVPVITRRGDRFLSHVGESIAHNAGMADWIAEDDDAYVAKAVFQASDLQRLAGLRGRLRQQVLVSPLFDAKRFARHFEAAMWAMWESRKSVREAVG